MPPGLEDILHVLGPTAPHLRALWQPLRRVSCACRLWAEDAYDTRMMALAQDLEANLETCYTATTLRSIVFEDLDEDHRRSTVRSMVVLGGTAELIFESILAHHVSHRRADPPPLVPATYECLLDAAYPAFDARILSDVPLGGRLGYAHIAELLTRVGELRVLVAPAVLSPFDSLEADADLQHPATMLLLWGEPEQFIRDACVAYRRLQRCRWAWPERGLPFVHWRRVD